MESQALPAVEGLLSDVYAARGDHVLSEHIEAWACPSKGETLDILNLWAVFALDQPEVRSNGVILSLDLVCAHHSVQVFYVVHRTVGIILVNYLSNALIDVSL